MTEKVAYHEAGHMCAAWELGLTVRSATIVPDLDRGYLGEVWCPVEDRIRYADWVDEDGYLYSFLVFHFAGIAAAERAGVPPLTPQEVQLMLDLGGGSDYHNAADFVLSLAGEDADEQAEIGDRAERHATNLVRARWKSVEAVARVLMQRETLEDEAECREVLEGAFGLWP